jgi:hypothetical protein
LGMNCENHIENQIIYQTRESLHFYPLRNCFLSIEFDRYAELLSLVIRRNSDEFQDRKRATVDSGYNTCTAESEGSRVVWTPTEVSWAFLMGHHPCSILLFILYLFYPTLALAPRKPSVWHVRECSCYSFLQL